MNVDEYLTRRELLESVLRASLLPGGAVFLANWLNAAQGHQHQAASDPLRDYRPQFFSPEDFAALQAFTEILIPSDETPGAREAHCAHFIDFVLEASGDSPQTQTNWRKAMQALKDAGFHKAQPDRRLDLVSEMAQPEVVLGATNPAYFAYRLIKQQNTFAFYTSRQGMIETLDYKGNTYNLSFPACTHPEHQTV